MKPIDLIEHPEGGRYREVFRSARTVFTGEGTARSALTHIYFSLNPKEVSRFHKVTSDEIWNLYQGEGIHLFLWDGTDTAPMCDPISPGELFLPCCPRRYLAVSRAHFRYGAGRLFSWPWF